MQTTQNHPASAASASAVGQNLTGMQRRDTEAAARDSRSHDAEILRASEARAASGEGDDPKTAAIVAKARSRQYLRKEAPEGATVYALRLTPRRYRLFVAPEPNRLEEITASVAHIVGQKGRDSITNNSADPAREIVRDLSTALYLDSEALKTKHL